jgi:hypothetical protein
MAVDIHAEVPCANQGRQHSPTGDPLDPAQRAIGFVRDQSLSNWWTPRCRVCLNRLSGYQPTRYEVVYLEFPSDIVHPDDVRAAADGHAADPHDAAFD